MKLRLLLLAGVAALVPAAVSLAQANASVLPRSAQFAPPEAPLIMTRTLVRTLVDGKQVVVTRRFLIRFTPEAGGYRLDGEQIDAAVEAPPSLAGLADMERKRHEKGPFPAWLNSQGMMLKTSSARDPETAKAGVGQGQKMIDATAIPDGAKRERIAVLNQVAGSSTGTAWPVFLFNPGSQERVERRKLALPSGGEGEVEVRITVQGVMASGLPQALERTIITRLSGTSRVTREVWTFADGPA